MTAGALELRLLGPVQAWSQGRQVALGLRRERLLLSVLALEANRSVPAERLVERLWPDQPPANAMAGLHTSIHRLRSSLDLADAADQGMRIITEPPGYRLVVDPQQIDVHRFSRIVHQARGADAGHRRAALLDQALRLWRGPPLADVTSDATRTKLCGRLVQMHVTAVEDWAAARLDAGEHREVLGDLTDLVHQHPLNERLVGQLMTALHDAGRTADALAAYHECRRRLVDELGVEPGSGLQAVYRSVLGGGPDQRLPAPPPHVASRSQRPRQPGQDVHVVPGQLPAAPPSFVGRRAELADLDAVLAGGSTGQPTIVGVSGMPGVGKSALATFWARRVLERFPDGQLYLDLQGFSANVSPVSVADAARSLLAGLAVPSSGIADSPSALSGLLRTTLAGRRLLLVLDNVRDCEQIRPLLPSTGGCVVVITSRCPLTDLVTVEGARLIRLQPPPAADAAAILMGRLGDRLSATEPDVIEKVVTLSGRLPLALTIMAARALTYPTLPVAALARAMVESSGLDGWSGGEPRSDLSTVFSSSYRPLGRRAKRLFQRLHDHADGEIDAVVAAGLAGTNARRGRKLVAKLNAVGLINEDAPCRYGIHPLLRRYAAEVASADRSADLLDGQVGERADRADAVSPPRLVQPTSDDE